MMEEGRRGLHLLGGGKKVSGFSNSNLRVRDWRRSYAEFTWNADWYRQCSEAVKKLRGN